MTFPQSVTISKAGTIIDSMVKVDIVRTMRLLLTYL